MDMSRLAIAVLPLVALVAGCASAPSPIGPGQIVTTDAREARMWEAARREAAELKASGCIYQDKKVEEYVQSVLVKVLSSNPASYLPLRPEVHVIDSPSVNAFAYPHGDIFIHTGALGRIRNEAQLAMLLGHEITHATHRHAHQRCEDVYSRTGAHAYIAVLSGLAGANIQNLAGSVSAFVTQAAIMGYSREKEAESDRVGLILMAQVGYDPREGVAMFQRMLDAADKKDRGWNFLYAEHPKMKARVASCRDLIGQLAADLQSKARDTGQDRYLRVASELIYREARMHITQGKFALALETANFMHTARPSDPEALALMGDLYRSRCEPGDPGVARKAYEQALELEPKHAPAQRGLGMLYMKEGNRAQAARHFEQYLILSPEATDAAYIRQYAEQLRKEN